MIRDSAIIFSPAGIPLGAGARHTLVYAARRAYRLVAVISEWALIDEMLRARKARVVLFAGNDLDVVQSDPEATGKSFYETARLLPRGDDGGFADTFLKASLDSRHTDDT